jgi:hypothetical protein
MPDTSNRMDDALSNSFKPDPATGFMSTLHGDVSTSSLVPVAVAEVLRIHKIPIWWVRSDVHESKLSSKYSRLEIQLIVSHWSDPLAMFAPVLENEIRMRLKWYQPAVDHARHTIAWRYLQNCGCPRSTIPNDIVWEDPKATAPEPSQDSLLDHRGNIRVG